MPLTVVKVLQNSPAEHAGLRNGDTISSINGADATSLLHEDSKKILADAGEELRIAVVRGLYDLVLDDYEPIYEPTDQDDFDQPSQPTEVPDYLDLTLTLPEFNGDLNTVNGNELFKPLPEQARSTTASPFLIPTKPYRPFSTEPLPEIPPLEQPIILNPDYLEKFGQLKDYEEFLPKTKFKLPISPQYDPDGTKQKSKLGNKDETTTKEAILWTDSKTVREETVKKDFEMKEESMKDKKEEIRAKQDVTFSEKVKTETGKESVELIAASIVDESIQKAVTVAEEIKREIDVELSESESETTKHETLTVKESLKVDVKKKTVKEAKELVEMIEKTTEEVIKQNVYSETKMSHEDLSETAIDSNQSERNIFERESTSNEAISKVETESQTIDRKDVERKVSKQEVKAVTDHKETQENISSSQSETITKDSKSETKYSTSKLLAEQRSYTIGLQTIPNIRGTVHSSYHYDLLLRTFFIHLTDVMVALSRFILAEPVLSKPAEHESKKDVIDKQEVQKESVIKRTTATAKQDTVAKGEESKNAIITQETAKVVTPAKKEKVVGKILQKAHEIKEQEKQESTAKVEESKFVSEQIHKTKYVAEKKDLEQSQRKEQIIKTHEKSGYKMAQLTDKKPEELMQKLEAVLTEFESKSANEDIEIVRERRSKSRSRVETPVDMFLEESSKESTELTVMSSSAASESKTNFESADNETSSDGSNKTYIAIVESHVYTNKDAIFDITKTTTAVESNEAIIKEDHRTVSSEKVATVSLETIDKSVQAVVDTSDKMVSPVREEKIEVKEKPQEEPKNVIQEVQKIKGDVMKEEAKSVEKVQDMVIQEITEPMTEEVKSSFVPEYTVAEAKEEIKSAKNEFVTEYKDEVSVKEKTISLKDEVKSVVKEDAAIKVETFAQKDQAVSYTEKSVDIKSTSVTEGKDEKDIATVALNELKKEEAIAEKEEVQTVEKASIAIQEEATAVEQGTYVVKEEVKEKVTSTEEILKDEKLSVQSTEEEYSLQEEVKKEFVSLTQDSIAEEETSKDEEKSAVLRISKEQIIEKEATSIEVDDHVDISVKTVEKSELQSKSQIEHVESNHVEQESKFLAKSTDQESSFVVKSLQQESTFVAKSLEQESTFVAKALEQESTFVAESVEQESAFEDKSVKQEPTFVAKSLEQESTFEDKSVKQEPTFVAKSLEQESTFEAKSVEQESTFVAKSLEQESTFVAKALEQESTFVAESLEQESAFEAKSVEQESTFVAKSFEQKSSLETKSVGKETSFVEKSVKQESAITVTSEQQSITVAKTNGREALKLDLHTDVFPEKVKTQLSDESTIDTPTPSTVPPTPLTDEYIFSLTTKLPKREGPPIPRDCTPSDDDEDPHIVKKGLVPHIDANIEDQKIFDPPLASPPTSPKSPTSPRSPTFPVYVKPGLRGGAPPPKRRELRKEEIKEIELKSSLLASAIDETIKSIEEYKEEVGIKKELGTGKTKSILNGTDSTYNGTESIPNGSESSNNGVIYNGYAKVVETKIYETPIVASKIIEENNIKELTPELNICERIAPTNGSNTETTQPTVELSESITASEPRIESPVTVTLPLARREVKQKMSTEETKHVTIVEETKDPMEGYRPVPFDPEELNAQREKRAALGIKVPYLTPSQERELYKTPAGEIIGTHQGIVDGLEEAVVNAEDAKELGKPGITEEKIAELISGEAEMLREAHVMGLSRVLASHMHRTDDIPSVDFKKIKPIVESLKDSEVLKALNEEMLREAEERKKKEDKTWTTFLQKPKRPVPKAKFGYYKDMEIEEAKMEPYKPKIVKQPKPKVAPDYKPKDFNTGLLPWEERALREPTPPPVPPEEPILIPEEAPEILEAVDPLPESEVPDLEDSGIPLPPPEEPKEPSPPPEEAPNQEDLEELDIEAVIEETEKIVEDNLAKEMERGNIAEQIMTSVQNMVDPNAPLEQQLAQMRAQLAALAQLPGVIQQSLELVTRQLSMLSQQDTNQNTVSICEITESAMTPAAVEETEVSENGTAPVEEQVQEMAPPQVQPEPVEQPEPTPTPEEIERMRREEEMMLEEQRKMEKQKKELMEQARIEHESRQVKQRAAPRVGRPKPAFGPAAPWERPVVLPGGRKWRKPKDAYDEVFITETLQSQAELIAGKAMGLKYESDRLPYDPRINFMKYEKPPVSLDHLKDSDTYKMIHNMEMSQPKRVEMLTPVVAEVDYREKCRSMTPCAERLSQQMQP